jgi:PAS domain S-box-containing protein
MSFFYKLFDTADFPARWHCGRWSEPHGWLHIISDIGIWSAYFAIPCLLLYFSVRRKDIPFRKLFLLFGAFILLCGMTHLMEAIIFWWPAYRLAGAIKLATALVSWTTVLALIPTIPLALAMRSPEELEQEIAARKRAEEGLHEANEQLEQRVKQRTAELEEANSLLHQEREWFRTTLASIGDAVIATDSDGRVTFLNEVAVLLTGWSPQEARGKQLDSVFCIINEESRQPVESPVQKALREGVAVGLANHTVLISRDGTERPVEDSAAPIRDEVGNIQGVVLVFRDGSEQRKLERRRTARLAVTHILSQAINIDLALAQVLKDVCESLEWDVGTFWAVDLQKNILQCQQSWHRPDFQVAEFQEASRTLTFGRDASLPGRVWVEGKSHWVPDVIQDEHFVRAEVAARIGLHGAFACPVSFDGNVMGVIEFFSREIREPDADLLEMMSTLGGQIGQFIQRRQAEANLEEAEERTRSVVEHVIDGVITIDDRGTIQTFNPAAERLFGCQAQEAIGRNVNILMPDPYRSEHDGYIARYLKSGQANVIGIGREVFGIRRDGSTFPMELSVSEFHFRGRRHFTGIVRDITERKRNEDELREIAAKLSEANRRKTEFLATLAHELRNPLAPIRTGLELMKMARGDEATLEETRSVMERQTRQLIALVDDLLDVSRITRGKLELRKCRIKLSDVVQSAVEASTPFIEEAGHKLVVSVPQQPIHLDADPNRLAQVVSNLLNNAAKYTPEGGHIWLSVERQGNEVLIAIRDDGLGIAHEMQERIFEMFAQIDRPMEKGYTGLGIGLTLVKSLTEMHGGRIEVRSDGVNQGSEFIARLPILDEMPVTEETPPTLREAASAGKLRVLVVDDNKAAMEILAKVVKMLGNEVHTASDGQDGVAAAAVFLPDIILMDIGMPKMNGYEAARQIRQQPWGATMYLVALTGWGQDEDKRRTKEAGFDYHLVKPAEPSELKRLFALVGQRRLASL